MTQHQDSTDPGREPAMTWTGYLGGTVPQQPPAQPQGLGTAGPHPILKLMKPVNELLPTLS